ncbi:MAG: alkaline phosphatase family protein [Kiritimatiellae bacterium]|nr:alkaline phosphatase family protein [Kiritimatiellia bacterium]
MSKDSKIISTSSYDETFEKLSKMLNTKSQTRRYFHTYIPNFDGSGHKNGVNSQTTKEVFIDLDIKIEKLAMEIKGTNTKLIITSDHGMIDTVAEDTIWIENFEGLKECLSMPLAGDSQACNCFVRPKKVELFKHIVETQMSDLCWCFEGDQLINDNFYGLGEPNKRLFDRVGDYVLIMKNRYVLKNKLANYETHIKNHIGAHGSVSPDEMLIPLIVVG